MKYLKYLYHEAHANAIDKDAAYLFVIDYTNHNAVQGDMPRGKQSGYIFCENKETFSDGRLVAHELGHGLYGLQHTFSPEYGVPQGTTDNLMDYTTNNDDFLAAWQWKIINNPMIVWNFLEGDEDAMAVRNFEIQLFEGNTRSNRDDIMLITTTPSMPDIRAKVVSQVKGIYRMKLEIKYLRQCTGTGISRTPNQITSFPATGWHEINEGTEWNIDFGMDSHYPNHSMIRGGIAYLIAESPAEVRDTIRFFIKGTNPTVQQLNTYLNQAPYNTVWFFKKIIFHESGTPNNLTALVGQFNTYNQNQENLSEDNWNAFSRMPNFGAPCGWGLGQLDNPSPPDQALWDWKANIRAAYDLLNGEKRGMVVTNLNNAYTIVSNWNEPGRPIVIQPDNIEGGITYTHAPSPSFNHNINTHFDGQLTNNRCSFIDACWIKTYNGLGREGRHYYRLVPSSNDNPPQWEITNIATYGNSVNYYVQYIGERPTP